MKDRADLAIAQITEQLQSETDRKNKKAEKKYRARKSVLEAQYASIKAMYHTAMSGPFVYAFVYALLYVVSREKYRADVVSMLAGIRKNFSLLIDGVGSAASYMAGISNLVQQETVAKGVNVVLKYVTFGLLVIMICIALYKVMRYIVTLFRKHLADRYTIVGCAWVFLIQRYVENGIRSILSINLCVLTWILVFLLLAGRLLFQKVKEADWYNELVSRRKYY